MIPVVSQAFLSYASMKCTFSLRKKVSIDKEKRVNEVNISYEAS